LFSVFVVKLKQFIFFFSPEDVGVLKDIFILSIMLFQGTPAKYDCKHNSHTRMYLLYL